jgi:hypothetical protein
MECSKMSFRLIAVVSLLLISFSAPSYSYTKDEKASIRKAIEGKDRQVISELISEKLSDNFTVEYEPLLAYLAKSKDVDFFSYMLGYIDYNDKIIARLVISKGSNIAVRDYLLTSHLDVNYYLDGKPLVHHVFDPDTIRYLVSKGGDIKKLSDSGEPMIFSSVGLSASAVEPYLKTLNELSYPFNSESSDGRKIAHEVAKAGQLKYLMLLRELNLDLTEEDDNGFSPIFYIMTTDLGVTYRNVYFKGYRFPSSKVFSALEYAIDANAEEAVNYIMSEYDFEISDGRIVDIIKNSDVARIMIAAGVDPDLTGSRGDSLASDLIMNGKNSIVSVLYHSGYELAEKFEPDEANSESQCDDCDYKYSPEYERYKVLKNYYESADIEPELGSCGAKLNTSNFPYGEWVEEGSESDSLSLLRDGTFGMVRSFFGRTEKTTGTWKVAHCGVEVLHEDGRLTYYPIRKFTGGSFEMSFHGLDRQYVRNN